jgi:hypothetical protein
MDVTLLKPLEVLEQSQESAFVWLAITNLVCDGIMALGRFLGDGRLNNSAHSDFCRFVYEYMHGDFKKKALDRLGNSQTFCWHLEYYFRSGLAHGFGIE